MTKFLILLIPAMLFLTSEAESRTVFLNGIDISSARSQELKNVNIVINEKGDVFIIAPHYQVNEEDTFIPLSQYVQGLNAPVHAAAKDLPKHPAAGTSSLEKAGNKEAASTGTPVESAKSGDKSDGNQ